MYRSSSLRSILNTGYITGLGMCKVACTEAVHCVALSKRTSVKKRKNATAVLGPLAITSYICNMIYCRDLKSFVSVAPFCQ